ncbi:uncharacterized protein [Watersipora subatra]|uniref:uncharacterized protein n=1 Tax=Watersipora subatra TaxID=2589382 RepID=UPI00355C97B1
MGAEIAQLHCTYNKDTQCISCPEGTFSNEDSSTQICQQHASCPRSSVEISPGNRTANPACQPEGKLSPGSITAIILPSLLVLVIIIFIIIYIIYCRKRRQSQNKSSRQKNNLSTTRRDSESCSLDKLNISPSEVESSTHELEEIYVQDSIDSFSDASISSTIHQPGT